MVTGEEHATGAVEQVIRRQGYILIDDHLLPELLHHFLAARVLEEIMQVGEITNRS